VPQAAGKDFSTLMIENPLTEADMLMLIFLLFELQLFLSKLQ